MDEKDLPIIFSYTRAQALQDGVLVDLTEWAKQLGFLLPVACTGVVWEGFIVPPEEARSAGQSERGRAHDLLWTLLCAIRRTPPSDEVRFSVLFQGTLSRPMQSVGQEFKAVCGPGDHGEPVATIMLPEED